MARARCPWRTRARVASQGRTVPSCRLRQRPRESSRGLACAVPPDTLESMASQLDSSAGTAWHPENRRQTREGGVRGKQDVLFGEFHHCIQDRGDLSIDDRPLDAAPVTSSERCASDASGCLVPRPGGSRLVPSEKGVDLEVPFDVPSRFGASLAASVGAFPAANAF